jgi:small conductance mechanosensitive channel
MWYEKIRILLRRYHSMARPFHRFSIISLCLLFLSLVPGFWGIDMVAPPLESAQAAAQDQKSALSHQAVGISEKTNKDTKSVSQETTDAERIIQMQNAIEADKKKLKELKVEIAKLQTAFEEKTAKLADLKDRIKDRKKELAKAQEKGTPSDAERLKAEIDSLDREYQNQNKESNLILQAEKTAREQIKTLTEKMEKNTQVLNRLKGIEERPEQEKSVAPAEKTGQGDTGTSQKMLPLGTALTPQPEQAPGTENPAAEQPIARAEQIEARKKAEVKKQEAERAAEAIVETVERKEALKKEIALATKMLTTYRDGQASMEQRLEDLEIQLNQKIAAGADPKGRQKIGREIHDIEDRIKEIQKEIQKRNKRLAVLNKELNTIQEEQILAAREAERKRKEAERARKRSLWLESPLHPKNLLNWAVMRGPKLVTALIVIALVLAAVRFASRRLAGMVVRHGIGTKEEREKRANTLGSTFRGAMSGAIIIGGAIILLEQAGLDIKALLGSAAVIGLAIAFGAQNLMRDYFNGFMILMEGQYQLNDWVKIGDVSGSVERITMRMTTLRDLEGCAHFIPNGEIKGVTNFTHKWAQVLLDIRVTYKEDADRVMGILMEIALEVRNDDRFGHFIVEEPVMLGVNIFTESGFEVRMLIKTRAGMQWAVRREMLRRIKNRFDAEGIEIPLPQRIVYQRTEENVS